MTLNRRRFTLILCTVTLLLIAACAPEGQRERGGDVGGDIRNLSESMNMHGEDDSIDRIFYETPRMGLGIERSQDARADDTES
jgi:hypothetical protein